MPKKLIAVGVIALLALAVGIWPSSVPTPGAAEPMPVDQTIDDLFAQIARDAPGFGGMYFEGDTLKVFVKDPGEARTDAVKRAVDAFFQARGDSPPGEVEILPGQYDSAQLKEWYDRSRDVVWAVQGVVFTDIDETNNRLRIGIEVPEVQESLEQSLKELGIPGEAVVFEISEPEVPDSSLRDRHRPLVAGLQVIGHFSGSSDCSLGFNAGAPA